MDDENIEITYPLKIKNGLWKKFKDSIPRSKTLNIALIELIEREVNKKR